MELKKFPIISKNNNEYEVAVYIQSLACISVWIVNIYKKEKYFTRIFKIEKEKFTKLYTYETSWHDYKKWIGKYKELAIKAIEKYEDELENENKINKKHNLGIKEFLDWDGKIL